MSWSGGMVCVLSGATWHIEPSLDWTWTAFDAIAKWGKSTLESFIE